MLFTVFTPIFNRRDTIGRVWDSLRAQTCRDFEWVVVDDGSTDGVGDLLGAYVAEADFPVQLARQENGGKHVAWNRGVAMARGELFVPADSDDAFVPETLERFRGYWLSIPEEDRPGFSGVNVLCRDPVTGEIVGTPFPKSPMVSQNLELTYRHRVRGEKWGCLRTAVLREVPFPAAEVLRGSCVTESYVWFTLARKYRALCVNDPLRLYYRDVPNSLMARRAAGGPLGRLTYNLPGRYFFHRWHLRANLDYLKRDRKALLRTIVAAGASGLLAGSRVRKALASLPAPPSRPRSGGVEDKSALARIARLLASPRAVAGRFLWRTGLCRAFTIRTDLYRLRFFPTALSCAMWTDASRRSADELFFRTCLRPGDTVVDVGANVGTLTLTAAALVGPGGRVLSVEAHPRTLRYLRANVELNGFTNVRTIQAAAGEEEGFLRFTDGRLDDQNRVSVGDGGLLVPARRLDDLVPEGRVRLLKMDVEGFELFALRGARRVLDRTEYLYFEYGEKACARYGYGLDEVRGLLGLAGFGVFELREGALLPFRAPRGHHQNLVGLRVGPHQARKEMRSC
jgi:FkbM family methyltransferase